MSVAVQSFESAMLRTSSPALIPDMLNEREGRFVGIRNSLARTCWVGARLSFPTLLLNLLPAFLLLPPASPLAMDSVLEVQRQTHEEIEHFERALYTILSRPQPTHESRLQTEHKASQLLDRISSRVVTLNNLYEDQETRKAELDRLSGAGDPNNLSEFYARLGKIQEHYVKYPETIANGFELELAALMDEGMGEEDEEYEQDDRE